MSSEPKSLTEVDAATALLVQAFEETDRHGVLLNQADRAPAAKTEGLDDTARLVGRAGRILKKLEGSVSGLESLSRVRWLALGWWPFLAALAVGLGLTAMPRQREINILNIMALGLIGYNLAVYVALGVSTLLRQRGKGWGLWLSKALTERMVWLVRRRPIFREGTQGAVAIPAVSRFLSQWTEAAAPLLRARTIVACHLAAIGLLVGTIAALYCRGLVFGYHATWDSTFLDVATVTEILEWLFWPGLWLLNASLPNLETLRTPATAPAAFWIHVYAGSALFWVVTPRALLAIFADHKARRLARHFPLKIEGPYFNRVLGRGDTAAAVRIVPYSFKPNARLIDSLHTIVMDVFGPLATLHHEEMVAYGDDTTAFQSGDTVVLLFSLAQTPEAEVQGDFVSRLKEGGARPIVLVDSSGWDATTAQIQERQGSWTMVMESTGFSPIHLEVGATAEPALLAAIWEQVA